MQKDMTELSNNRLYSAKENITVTDYLAIVDSFHLCFVMSLLIDSLFLTSHLFSPLFFYMMDPRQNGKKIVYYGLWNARFHESKSNISQI